MDTDEIERRSASDVLTGVARGLGGALIFGIPMLMTMELWDMGHLIDRFRLALLVVVFIPLLIGVAHRIGFEETFGWREDLVDTMLALGVGVASSVLILFFFGVLRTTMTLDEACGAVAVQSVGAALGALLGRSQFGRDAPDDETRALSGYFGTLFLMLIGAMFLSLNVAPTEEMILISYRMSPWQAVGLILASLFIMQAFFLSEEADANGGVRRHWLRVLVGRSLTGYVMALALSAYVLWTFGRFEGLGTMASLKAAIVLAFPASIGAAAARLIL